MNFRINQPDIITNYAKKDRLIPQALYKEIKARKKCRICGRKKGKHEAFQIHHKIPVSQGGKHIHTNLILVCPECHIQIHNGNKTTD